MRNRFAVGRGYHAAGRVPIAAAPAHSERIIFHPEAIQFKIRDPTFEPREVYLTGKFTG